MKIFKFNKVSIVVLAVAFVFGLTGVNVVHAVTAVAPDLGLAKPFAVLGFSEVTCTGATTVNGEVGVSTSTLISGFPTPCTVVSPSITHSNDQSAIDGQAAILTAYGRLAAQPVGTTLDLGVNNTVTPGIYEVGAVDLNGKTLTLDGPGVYIFRSSSSLTDVGSSTVSLIHGATAGNVFWQIPISMSIGTGTHMVGTIIANAGAITIATGATLNGRALTKGTNITLDANIITVPTTLTLVKATGMGGPLTPGDFTLHADGVGLTTVNGLSGTAAVTHQPVAVGTYTLSEIAQPNYAAVGPWTCSGKTVGVGNTVSLLNGDDVTCTLENIYTAPVVVVVHHSSGGSYVPPAFLPSINIISTPVVVAPIIPKLPKTGFAPQEKSAMFPIVLLSGLSLVSIFLYFAQKKQTI